MPQIFQNLREFIDHLDAQGELARVRRPVSVDQYTRGPLSSVPRHEVTMRRNPIYPATLVGRPPVEDVYLGGATERIFLPLAA